MADTPTGTQAAAILNAHAEARAGELAALQQALQQTSARINDALQRHEQALQTGREAARQAIMKENELAALQGEHDKLKAQFDALHPVVAEKAALVTACATLRKQIADLEAKIAAMVTHPDVIAAKEKAAAEVKAAQIAALEKTRAEAEAKLAALKA